MLGAEDFASAPNIRANSCLELCGAIFNTYIPLLKYATIRTCQKA